MMNSRANTIRVKIIPRGENVSDHSPVPLLPLDAAASSAGCFPSPEFGVFANVIEIKEEIVIKDSMYRSQGIDPNLKNRRRIILEDVHPNRCRFYLNCFGCFATNMNHDFVHKGDQLIITKPYVCKARKSQAAKGQFCIYLGLANTDKSEVIICRYEKSDDAEQLTPPKKALKEVQNLHQGVNILVSCESEGQKDNFTKIRDTNQNSDIQMSCESDGQIDNFGHTERHCNIQRQIATTSSDISKVIYTQLENCNDLSARYNIWGVVTNAARPPSLTSNGTRFMSTLYIQDETYKGSYGFQDFQLNILGKACDDFSPVVGDDVIRVKGLKVEQYNGYLTGKVFNPQAVTVFKGKSGDPIRPITTSKNIKLTDTEFHRVEQMRQWKDARRK